METVRNSTHLAPNALDLFPFARRIMLTPPVTATSGAAPTSSSDNAAGSTSEQAAAAGDKPKRKPSFLNVPHSSSQTGEEAAASGSGLSGATASDGAESVGRGSKRSFLGKRRAGSTASSKRSQKARAATSEKAPENAQAVGAAGPAPQVQPKKKSGVSRILLILNCCAVPEKGNVVGQEELPEAPKKATKLRSVRKQSAPPAPAKQKDVSAAESSTADSKEPVEEKAGKSTEAGPKDFEKQPLPGDAQADKPVPEAPSAPSQDKSPDQPLPPVPQPDRLDTSAAAGDSPQVSVQAPTPVVPSEEQAIADRTPEQQARDADIEMTDAGPSIPIAANEVPTTEEGNGEPVQQREAGPTKIDLPPPPPLVDRQAQTAPPSGSTPQSQDSSLAVTPAEPQQKWLLPPIKPEFKGKKCLVLDLDETLVHSSFKVSWVLLFVAPQTLIVNRSFTRPTSRSPSRLRGNTTTFTSLSALVSMPL